ncbi:hypothetical protein GLOIN_2v1791078 [Rhizophagus irregularis DAOM 181602=DAOM 197198]|uniref:Uncharacterized protein n=1 Tax=Rhizophagus irregularis (strain DAOM 181602 / DAOM 197198 / MUCL 43194) TaxID=747089 RepID=A0A2P4NXS0_RHIID|nr:hypothetical protein GLOIN_2v1791078 [Rhizophagus irregularis DAOM 181602=DAOM 197198]POG57935.1 hypothetical protein GLOIN_2v1791078 [Rhizophagus irregularis DAOM 181602=DAOM 197198]|eukprot:XP_025164801.1 hypothetical protein GLOIN_2v1791078 [Rhizophagus irregularis DAOM 181602=DAOM 197198]
MKKKVKELLKSFFLNGNLNQKDKMLAKDMYNELMKFVESGELEAEDVPKITTIQNWISTYARTFKEQATENMIKDIHLSVNDVILRTHDEMCKYFENDTQKSVCIESNINIYLTTVPDRMYHLDLSLFRYQIIFTCNILKLQHVNGNKLVEEVDRRLAAIPRFPSIKIFSNGLQSIARLTANEYRSLIKVMIFVIDNLYDENNNEVDNFVNNDDLAKLYKYWNEMYILSRYEEFSESDLEKFNIKHQVISIRMSQHSVNPAKTPRTCKFSARLFEFSLQDANTFFNEKKNSVDNKMQTSFARFIGYLDSYLDLLNGFTIIVWFSDIAISMDSEESNDYISDKGLCYRQQKY